ncbi:MAG: DUF1800 domain-containing protein [Acidobacteriota bacterium]
MDQNPYANRALPRTGRSLAGLEPYAGSWGAGEMLHLLRRTLFSIGQADRASLDGTTLDGILDLLFTPGAAPSPPLNNYGASTADPDVPTGQTWIGAPYGSGSVNGARTASFKAWWIGQMLGQTVSLREKMTLFWHNHFATETAIVGDARYAYRHNALLRQHALGNFKTLVKQVTIDPSMLRYLNGNANTRTNPNENYGRELLELFTIGKGRERAAGDYTNYTEDDVKAASRVLTGWRDDVAAIGSYFDADRTPSSSRHDPTDKQFSSAFGGTVIKGRSGPDGKKEIDDLIEMIFAQEETSRFIARKLYRWFVYYVIDDAIEANVIAPMASILRANDFEVAPALRALLSSAHFFDPVNRGCMIKNPIDFTVGLCRQYGCAFPDASSAGLAVQYQAWDYIRNQAAAMNMNAGDPPDVSGWAAYWLTPQYYELWINADTLTKRNIFSDLMISTNGYSNKKIVIDPIAFASRFSDPSDPGRLIDEMTQFLYAIPITANQKAELKSYLLSGQASDYYWTDAWNTYAANPSNASNRTIVFTRLQSMIRFMMSSMAEYQLS